MKPQGSDRMHTHPQKGNGLFITSMFSMVMSIALVLMSLYIVPFLFWQWPYGVPTVVVYLREWYSENYQMSENASAWAVVMTFLLPGLLAGFVTWYASSKFEKLEFPEEAETEESVEAEHGEPGESVGLGLQILFFIVLIFLATWVVEQFVSASLT